MKRKYCPFCDILFTYEKEHVTSEKNKFYLICPVCKRKIEVVKEEAEK